MPWLLGGIAGLSAVDLVMTLGFMTTIGMFEMNPIVHALTRTPCPAAAIALFKTLTTALALTVLYALRRRRSAVVAARLMACVLAWLTVQWVRYGTVMSDLDAATLVEVARETNWVVL
jgi:hypothetical protein